MPSSVDLGLVELLRNSDLFDQDWYRNQYPDVSILGMDPIEHYLWIGAELGRNPSAHFSTHDYLLLNADVAQAAINPLVHYYFEGRKEGRLVKRADGENLLLPSEDTVFLNRRPPGDPKNLKAKLIAFYLPQFHAIPENDEWWGLGFTEWTNVRPTRPLFHGHYQPHIPHPDLGYYDLGSPGTMAKQVDLAKLYGVSGFCFYYYRFAGKRLLERPLDLFLADKSLDFNFCLCWANENWTRRWDGMDQEVLIAQAHSAEDDIGCIADLARYARDERYIRIDGKPLIMVYRPQLLPDPRQTAERWRSWARQNGLGEIYLAYTQSFEKADPKLYGFDSAVEFPPNNSAPPNLTGRVQPLSDGFEGTVFDWSVFVDRSEHYEDAGYPIFRSVCPGWDNTARRKAAGTVFVNNTPALYEKWLANAIVDTQRRIPSPENRLIFVNAWNEWAEGAHLEPDNKTGFAYLEATRNALEEIDTVKKKRRIIIVSHDAHPHGAQFLALNMARCASEELGFSVDVVLLETGSLAEQFAKYGAVHDLTGQNLRSVNVKSLIRSLQAAGSSWAICNTTVSGLFASILKENGLGVVSLIHELPQIIRSYRLEENVRMISGSADHVFFAAPAVLDGFRQFSEIDPSKAYIRPQGLYKSNRLLTSGLGHHLLRSKLRETMNFAPNVSIVLGVGYADERKGVDLFVEAGVRLIQEGCPTEFIWIGKCGSEDWMKKVMKPAELANLTNRFHFVGHKEDTDLYYAGSDVYALTSREDPYPSVVLEAMESGLPVIAFFGTGGMDDLIERAGGRSVPAFDVAAYAGAIREYLQSPALLANATKNGRNIIEREYHFKKYVHNLLGYTNLLPRISVVVPNFNYARYIVDRLQSIVNQTVPPYELIVLDDRSTDNSIEVIEEFLSTCDVSSTLITNAQNSGSVFRQWQKGVELAQGDLVWIAEADDLAAPDFLEELVGFFDHSEVVMAFSQSSQIDSDGVRLCGDYLDYVSDLDPEKWTRRYIASGFAELSSALYLKNTVPNVSGVVFKREAILKVLSEHFDEITSFRNAGDWVTYIRLMELGSIGFCPRSLNDHRRHSSSVTLSNFNLDHLKEIALVQQSVIDRHDLGEAASEKAETYCQILYKQFGLNTQDHPNYKTRLGNVSE